MPAPDEHVSFLSQNKVQVTRIWCGVKLVIILVAPLAFNWKQSHKLRSFALIVDKVLNTVLFVRSPY